MRDVTICFLLKENKICLALKKRGFGAGKWNGVGGKVEPGEAITTAAARELKEEIGVSAKHEHLEHTGTIDFHFNDNPSWNQRMHIFLVRVWEGEPGESEEMAPQWYEHDKIPFEKMWVDDPHWLPRIIAGKKILGKFHFRNNGTEIDEFEIKEI